VRPYVPPPSPPRLFVHKWNNRPVTSTSRVFNTDALDGWVFAAGMVLGTVLGFMLALLVVR